VTNAEQDKLSGIELPLSVELPSHEYFSEHGLKKIIADNPTVTFNLNDKPLSRFNDAMWDFSFYSDSNSNNHKRNFQIDFSKLELSPFLLNELKLLLISIFLKEYPISNNAKYCKNAFKHFIPFFSALDKLNIKSIQAIGNSIVFYRVLELLKGKWQQDTLVGKLSALRKATKLYYKDFDFTLPIVSGKDGSQTGQSITEIAKTYGRSVAPSQALYIPSAIHQKMVGSAYDLICEAEDKIDDIVLFMNKWISNVDFSIKQAKTYSSTKDDSYSKSTAGNYRNEERRGCKSLTTISKECNLYDIHTSYLGEHNSGIYFYRNLIASSCYIIINSFTGMRNDEMSNIKLGGYNISTTNNQLHFIRSYETKISGGEIVDYITSPIAQKAFNLLLKIHSPFYNQELFNDEFLIKQPASMDGIGFSSYRDLYGVRRILKQFIKHFDVTVTGEDIEQHSIFNKSTKKIIKIGDYWPISSHQFRRTLIVNFITHDLASLSATKQQVKHMYAGMTEYYGQHSDLAISTSMSRSHDFVNEIENERMNINIELYKRLHYGDEHLEGKKGNEIEDLRGVADFLSDAEIKILYRTGAFKITRTPYGYCTKGNLCDKTDVVDPTFCGAKCETMIITIENALNWQKLYKRNIKLLSSELLDGFHGTETMMKAQNSVAKKIMNSFELTH
jgi:hypothetical protein